MILIGRNEELAIEDDCVLGCNSDGGAIQASSLRAATANNGCVSVT